MADHGWTRSWERVDLDGEQVRRGRVGEATAFLGCGPPRQGEERAARLERLSASLGLPVRGCSQVHGRTIASLGVPHLGRLEGGLEVGICDGLVTDLPGLLLVVWTADCVPVLIAGGGVVAAIHAGWKGAAGGIVPAAVRRIEVEYGVPPDELRVVLGPAVGACHYPVGEDVVSALSHAVRDPRAWLAGDRVDLRRFLALQLEGLGVAGVVRAGPCTACDPDLASYRRDGPMAGRQWSGVVLST